MTIGQELMEEFAIEMGITRRYLASVPFDKKNFKPAEKSEELGRLAIHIAEIVAWWKACLEQDKLDFIDFEPIDIQSTEALLSYFDDLVIEAKATLNKVQDAEFNREWSMTYGDEVLFFMKKKQVIKSFCMSHLVHHRAQLGVYLRLLDIPVPATYGPSADDDGFAF